MVKHLFLFYLFTTQTPAPTLSPLSDLQLVDTKRAISTTCSQSLLWWVSRYAVSVVIYLDYPRPIITTTPLHSPLPSMQGTHFKDQARPPPVSLISPEPHIGSDNLSLLWGRSHWVLTTRWNAWWYPRVQVASPVFPELRRRGSENGRNLYSWDVHRLVGGRALQINQDNTVWSDFSDWGVGGTYWKEGALALPGAATVKAAGQLRPLLLCTEVHLMQYCPRSQYCPCWQKISQGQNTISLQPQIWVRCVYPASGWVWVMGLVSEESGNAHTHSQASQHSHILGWN